MAEHFDRNLRKVVDALFAQPQNDLAQRLVVDVQAGRPLIRLFVAIFFRAEVEQAGVVAGVGVSEQMAQPFIDFAAVLRTEQPSGDFDPAIFADAQKNDAIDRHLHGIVERERCHVVVHLDDIFGEQFAPVLHLIEERIIDGDHVFELGRLRLSVFFERAPFNRLTRE